MAIGLLGSCVVTGITEGTTVTEDAKTDVLMTFTTKNAADTLADASRVEYELLVDGFAVKRYTALTSSDSTGVYTATIPAADFQVGLNIIQARAQDTSGSPALVVAEATGRSEALKVTAIGQATPNFIPDAIVTELNQMFNEKESPAGMTIWKKFNVTGTKLKAASGVNSGATKDYTLMTLPANAILVGGVVKPNTADAGTATTTTVSMGANSTSFNEIISAASVRATTEVGVGTSFVPNLAGGTALKAQFAVTGSGKTITHIDNGMDVDLYVAYVDAVVSVAG